MTREQECEIEAAAFLKKASVAAGSYDALPLRRRVERALELLLTAKARIDEAEALRANRLANEPPAANDPGKAGL